MLHAKDEQNKDIDWWFVYKTPDGTGSKDNKGYHYFYYDASSSALELSAETLDQKAGALDNTLAAIFRTGDPDQGYIVYNDEQTDSEANVGTRGHCKGVLAFNKSKDTGVFLLHSTPRFPKKGESTLPDEEKIYGQTYLCITLPDYKTVSRLAAQMLDQQNPQVLVEDCYLPSDITSDEALYKLYHETDINESATPSTVSFKSKGGKSFHMIAKSRTWGKDFWLDLISPQLGVDMNVETWRRGTVSASTDAGNKEEDEDVMDIDCTGIGQPTYNWSYTKDHSKWGAAESKDLKQGAWVCIADINRMISQEKRGGGGLCFEEPNLWKGLNSMEEKLQVEKKK